jgi:uncharacterized protein (TIRG00374 family)
LQNRFIFGDQLFLRSWLLKQSVNGQYHHRGTPAGCAGAGGSHRTGAGVRGPLAKEIQTAGVVTTVMVVVGFLVLVLLSRQRALAQQVLTVIFRLLSRFGIQSAVFQEKLSRWLNHFLDGLQPLTDPGRLLRAVGYTAISWILSLWAGYLLMVSFFSDATWAATFMYMAASSLAIAVPAAPGNLGPFELSILLALNASGYADVPDTVIAFALFVHGVYLVINVATGLIGMVTEGISLRQLY